MVSNLIRRTYDSCRPVGLSLALGGIREQYGDFSRWYHAAPEGMVEDSDDCDDCASRAECAPDDDPTRDSEHKKPEALRRT